LPHADSPPDRLEGASSYPDFEGCIDALIGRKGDAEREKHLY